MGTNKVWNKTVITFSKDFSKPLIAEKEILEKELTDFEKSDSNYSDYEYYIAVKKLDNIYDKKVENVKAKSKCDWCEDMEIFTTFFITLEEKNMLFKTKLKL